MKTTVTERGQTAIPAALREKFGIRSGMQLEWLDDGQIIKVIPVLDDPLRALRGRGRGEGLTAKLLKARQEERERGA